MSQKRSPKIPDFTPDYIKKTKIFNKVVAYTVSSMEDGYAYENNCYRHEYRETYVPGTASSPGYVRKHSERIKIPCGYGDYPSYGPRKVYRNYTPSPDGNECGDGKLAGALVGGGAGAALSRGDGRWWAIPLGILVGSTVGCDMAGG